MACAANSEALATLISASVPGHSRRSRASMRCTTPRSVSRLPQAMSEASLGQLVLADLAVEHQLIQSRLHNRHGRGQLFEVDEPAVGVVGRRQEGRRRPVGAVGAVAPGDAAEVLGIEQQRPDVDVAAARGRGHLLGDLALRRPG